MASKPLENGGLWFQPSTRAVPYQRMIRLTSHCEARELPHNALKTCFFAGVVQPRRRSSHIADGESRSMDGAALPVHGMMMRLVSDRGFTSLFRSAAFSRRASSSTVMAIT